MTIGAATSVRVQLPFWSTLIRCLGQKGKRTIVLILIFIVGTAIIYNERIVVDISIGYSSGDDPLMSYCSGKADRRGLHQNVISYSLYGNFSDLRHYNRYAGAINYLLSNISQVYPGWTMRVYSDLGPNGSMGSLKLKQLFEPYPFVDLCNVSRVMEIRNITRPIFPMTWRFLPLMDPTVDRMLCRDMDSIITHREVAAVHQWLDSNVTFHLMHDHPFHCALYFLGCAWGSKTYQNRQAIFNAASSIFYGTNHPMQYGFDQVMLDKYIAPVAKNDLMHHETFCCEKFRNSIPFPTRRLESEYVGQIVDGFPYPLPKICPERCRPKDHPDWTRC